MRLPHYPRQQYWSVLKTLQAVRQLTSAPFTLSCRTVGQVLSRLLTRPAGMQPFAVILSAVAPPMWGTDDHFRDSEEVTSRRTGPVFVQDLV